MENFIVASTEFTPRIDFNCNTNVFEVEGMSRPENVNDFYNKVIAWFQQYSEKTINDFTYGNIYPVVFNFKLTYFNSASAKKIWELLYILDQMDKAGVNVTINWYYEEDDETILEGGEELEDAVEVSFNYIIIKE